LSSATKLGSYFAKILLWQQSCIAATAHILLPHQATTLVDVISATCVQAVILLNMYYQHCTFTSHFQFTCAWLPLHFLLQPKRSTAIAVQSLEAALVGGQQAPVQQMGQTTAACANQQGNVETDASPNW
jgi:hypothetical protein